MRRSLRRIAAMDRSELAWRLGEAARTLADRATAAASPPRWNRRALLRVLAPDASLQPVRAAASAEHWQEAHSALARHFGSGPQRFAIAPGLRRELAARINHEFPDARRQAGIRAERIVDGTYNLLGYEGLRFGGSGARVDWHYDPVHDRRPPFGFWSTVPYLSPESGDHKIIWELNRHQHFLALGRGYWLTGERRFRAAAIEELSGWLPANPPLMGINWASMLELAFRTLSWTWAINFFAEEDTADATPWLVDLVVALDRQLTHVEQHLSYYFSPNTHLLGEALALYVSGRSLPALRRSARREGAGRSILLAEIGRQIAADGGHCERSTHYHRYTLDFYLLALIVARITGDRPAAEAFEGAVARLAFAARLLADDRGRVPHFGDDDGGAALLLTGRAVDDLGDSLAVAAALIGRSDLRVGPAPEEAFWLLAHPTLAPALDAVRRPGACAAMASAALPDTGYFVSRSEIHHLVIDGGAHGYSNGGHAHADALSMTMSVCGVPLLVDPGTGVYTSEPTVRDWFRSSPMHNTLTLDGESQSTPAGPFHWARIANAAAWRWRANAGFDYFDGVHDGYRPAEHRRRVLALHGDLVVVADLVTGRGAHRADVHWHIDPSWQVRLAARRALFLGPGGRAEFVASHGQVELFNADSESGLGWQAPVYGRIETASTLRIRTTGTSPAWIFSVFGLDPANEVQAVEMVPVWSEAGQLRQAAGLRITRAAAIDHVLLVEPAPDAAGCWRLAQFETDARVLFCRTGSHGEVTRLAFVDGSLVRVADRRRLQLTLPREVPDLHLDLTGLLEPALDLAPEVRTSGPASGLRLQIGGRDLAVTVERARAASPTANER